MYHISLITLHSTAIICLLNLVILLYVGSKLRHKLNIITRKIGDMPGLLWDNANLYASVAPVRPLPKPGSWAASSDFLLTLLRLLETRRPKLVVELGSGLSTVIIAYGLQRAGNGTLVSIEHDERYAEQTRALIAYHGLQGIAEVRLATLVIQDQLPGGLPWYDLKAFSDLKDIDFLVIDGPPAAVGPTVRLPAVYAFADRLKNGAIVMLDDANRPSEKSIVNSWTASFPHWEFSSVEAEKGLMVACKSTNGVQAKPAHSRSAAVVPVAHLLGNRVDKKDTVGTSCISPNR